MSTNVKIPPNNGTILNIAHIIKHVMTSAMEAELVALYIMAREAGVHENNIGRNGTHTTGYPHTNR